MQAMETEPETEPETEHASRALRVRELKRAIRSQIAPGSPAYVTVTRLESTLGLAWDAPEMATALAHLCNANGWTTRREGGLVLFDLIILTPDPPLLF